MSRLYWLITVAFVFTACATTPLSEEFKRVKLGMEKDEVLLIMGTPNVYRRVRSNDVYLYSFFENDKRIEREVQFFEGRVTYAGSVTKPAESAEEADQRIKKENELADAAYAHRKQMRHDERKQMPTLEQELKSSPKDKPVYKDI